MTAPLSDLSCKLTASEWHDMRLDVGLLVPDIVGSLSEETAQPVLLIFFGMIASYSGNHSTSNACLCASHL